MTSKQLVKWLKDRKLIVRTEAWEFDYGRGLELAKHCGTTRRQLRRYIHGENKIPQWLVDRLEAWKG